MTDFATTSDNGISKVLPDDREKFSGRLVPAAGERRGPAHPDHRVATSGQPVDIGHVVEFDGHDRFARERKPLRQMSIQQLGIGQETCRNRKQTRTELSVDDDIRRQLPGSRRRPEMSGHPIKTAGFKTITHGELRGLCLPVA